MIMVKKVLGGLFFVAAAVLLIGMVGNIIRAEDYDWGSAFASLLAVVLYVLSGIFMLRFDGVSQKKVMNGFRARKAQCSKIVLFVVIYGILAILASVGAALSMADNYIVAWILAILPYIIPVCIFAGMMGTYVIPYKRCQKLFGLNDAALRQYMSCGPFRSYSQDRSVIANDAVLYFPKLFCLVPFDQIASIKFVNMVIEQDIVFTLKDGKKVEIVGGKQKYNCVAAAINAHRT